MATTRSHPTWVRGLKLGIPFGFVERTVVAPYVGAWIETRYVFNKDSAKEVAPYVGAWIETFCHNRLSLES